MKYNVIYADPSWQYNDKSKHRGGAERHYRTLPLEKLKKLDVNSIADQNCGLIMWATYPKIEDAIQLIKAWGFKYKTCLFTWVKLNKRVEKTGELLINDQLDLFLGMGHYSRSNAEICLLATKGSLKRQDAGIRQIITSPVKSKNTIKQLILSPVKRHSEKPEEARARIEKLFGNVPRIELFARKKYKGWHSWGDQVKSDIEIKWN